jgi:hypothetical protein
MSDDDDLIDSDFDERVAEWKRIRRQKELEEELKYKKISTSIFNLINRKSSKQDIKILMKRFNIDECELPEYSEADNERIRYINDLIEKHLRADDFKILQERLNKLDYLTLFDKYEKIKDYLDHLNNP